jgi:hypothetical protein
MSGGGQSIASESLRLRPISGLALVDLQRVGEPAEVPAC